MLSNEFLDKKVPSKIVYTIYSYKPNNIEYFINKVVSIFLSQINCPKNHFTLVKASTSSDIRRGTSFYNFKG